MRPDIAKLLVERPRKGGGYHELRRERRVYKIHPNQTGLLHHSLNEDVDDSFDYELPAKHARLQVNAPKNVPVKRPHQRNYNMKTQSEYFPPLLGFLKKHVGRSWNKVNSEIREHLNPTSTIHDHVLVHLYRDFVEQHAQFVDGVPMVMGWWSGLQELSNDRFYVDPHGILRQWRKKKPAKKKSEDVRKYINALEEYRRLDGVWFWVRYEHLRNGTYARDVILKRTVTAPSPTHNADKYLLEATHGQYEFRGEEDRSPYIVRVCVQKIQCSSRVIKKAGLNDLK